MTSRFRTILTLSLAALLFAALSLGLGTQDSVVVRTGFYGPRVPLRVNRPTLRWEVWCDAAPVLGGSIKLNGQEVASRYDLKLRSLVHEPAQALSPGVYSVECEVNLTGGFNVKRQWTTTIRDDAVSSLPVPSTVAAEALAWVNAKRLQAKQPPMVLDPALSTASQSHADYLERHGMMGHGETASQEGYSGATPNERAESLGWAGNVSEGMTYTHRTLSASLTSLYDAPYHRFPFLQPGRLSFGFGRQGTTSVALFGEGDRKGFVVSPPDGATDVGIEWGKNDQERPDPLRLHPIPNHSVGYPIVIVSYAGGKGKLALLEHRLTHENGAVLECWVNSPANDDQLTDAAIIMPKQALRPGTTYRFQAKAKGTDGKPFSVRSTFRTISLTDR